MKLLIQIPVISRIPTFKVTNDKPIDSGILYFMGKAIKNPKIGDKAGKLTLVDIKEEKGLNNHNCIKFYCVCDCGNVLLPMCPSSFGNKTSCGCKDKERIHYKSHTKVWRSWRHMKTRCYNKKNHKYRLYGEIGRFVCDGLKDFKNFYHIMGEPLSSNHSLDRINNHLSYTCGSCKQCLTNGYLLNVHWATPKEQSRNVKTNFLVEFMGKKMCLSEAAEMAGMPYKTVHTRIKYRGWSVNDALTIPISKSHSHKKIKNDKLSPF